VDNERQVREDEGSPVEGPIAERNADLTSRDTRRSSSTGQGTTSPEGTGDDMLSRRPGEGDQTPDAGVGGFTADHAAGDITSAFHGEAARNLQSDRGQTDLDAGGETGFGADYGDTPRTVAVGHRDEEEAEEMPGGAAGYAGRGDTDSGIEAPGGTEGYSSEHLPEDADDVVEDEYRTDATPREARSEH
jgi:hypothetical protein